MMKIISWIRATWSVTLFFQSSRCFSLNRVHISPSPLQVCRLFGRNVYVKRDDLLHLNICREVNGNKVRKFKSLLTNSHSSHIVSYGGSQSNAMRALALLSKAVGKTFLYFTRPIAKVLLNQPSGNLKDSLEVGMEYVELEKLYYNLLPSMVSSRELLNSNILTHPKVLSLLNSCCDADILFVPQGGAMDAARAGVFDLCNELEQFICKAPQESQSKPWKIYFASGTGTMALYAAQYFSIKNTLKLPVEIVAIPCMGDEHILWQNMEELDRRTFQLRIFPTILSTANAPHHSFAKPSKAHYDIWNSLRSMTDGIEFDLLYAPRAFEIMLSQGIFPYGASGHSLQNPLQLDDYNIIYYHCGGVEGNRSQLKRYEYLKMIDVAPSIS